MSGSAVASSRLRGDEEDNSERELNKGKSKVQEYKRDKYHDRNQDQRMDQHIGERDRGRKSRSWHPGDKRHISGRYGVEDSDGSPRRSKISRRVRDWDGGDRCRGENFECGEETEANLVNLRTRIYLTIMSSVNFEEAGHKLSKIKLKPGQEMELCMMLVECCKQDRTYPSYHGLLAQRFCTNNKAYKKNFEKCFVQQYSMIHRLETNKLRNVAKLLGHLLGADALPWHVLAYIRLTEEDTTMSSRIFIKILFQELSEHLGIPLLKERLDEPTMQAWFESIFPKNNPKNTRFSINFFTSIGLGGITEHLREYLKICPVL